MGRGVGGSLIRTWRAVGDKPLPGPFRSSFWRSPIRGPWLTAVLGSILLLGLTVLLVTGLLSYAAYNPELRGNDMTPNKGVLGFYLFPWPTEPYWLYRLTQGVHVILGFVLVPVVLAKLWSVVPKLFDWPPARSLAHLLERLSLALLVGSVIFEFATGIINTQYWYAFPGSFYQLHFYGAWVFFGAFGVHIGIRIPRMIRALRSRSLRPRGQVLGDGPNDFQINKTAAYYGLTDAQLGPSWRLERLRHQTVQPT